MPANLQAPDGSDLIKEMDLEAAARPYLSADGSTMDAPEGKSWLLSAWNNRDRATNQAGKIKYYEVYSESMGRRIPVNVITPTGEFDVARPTIYLLNGAGGAEQGVDWITMTAGRDNEMEDVVAFYTKKNVNVVIPQEGAFSYYTDWLTEPKGPYYKGPQMWETFLTKELPGPLEAKINGNGKRAVAGMSMAATSSLLLAEHHPKFYDAVGSYSGCAATNTLFPRFYTYLTVQRGGANPDQMWGPMWSDYAVYNDALVNSNNLAGKEIYVSTNSGLAGETDMLSYIMDRRGGSSMENFSAAFKSSSTLVVEGGAIEAAMNACTHDLERKMAGEGITGNFNYRSTGTHSWPGWRKDIHESWPTYAKAFDQNPDPKFEDPARLGAAPEVATADDVKPVDGPKPADDKAAIKLDPPADAPADTAGTVPAEEVAAIADKVLEEAAAAPAPAPAPASAPAPSQPDPAPAAAPAPAPSA
ncbi:esterase family protein [Corynebacterium phocae]|nr:esterase family protein [Corynebacterium phocae]